MNWRWLAMPALAVLLALAAAGQEPEEPANAEEPAAGEETPPAPREVVLDREVTLPTLGMKLRLAPRWSVETDPLGYRRLHSEGPIEFGLQTSFTVWVVANEAPLEEKFRGMFERFLARSYPELKAGRPAPVEVGGAEALSWRLEGELGKEGGVVVPAVHAFTVVDRGRYKLILRLVWPRQEDDYYSRLYEGMLRSVEFTGPVIYRRRKDGVVEVADYVLKPLAGWLVDYEESRDEERQRVVHYITLTNASLGARLRYKLVRENVVSTPGDYAHSKFLQYRKEGLPVEEKKLKPGLVRLLLSLEVEGVRNRVLAFFSGRPGKILVVTVHVPEENWEALKGPAEEMGATFALRSYPTPFLPAGEAEAGGRPAAGKPAGGQPGKEAANREAAKAE